MIDKASRTAPMRVMMCKTGSLLEKSRCAGARATCLSYFWYFWILPIQLYSLFVPSQTTVYVASPSSRAVHTSFELAARRLVCLVRLPNFSHTSRASPLQMEAASVSKQQADQTSNLPATSLPSTNPLLQTPTCRDSPHLLVALSASTQFRRPESIASRPTSQTSSDFSRNRA